MSARRDAGFTLVEVMIALMIFGMIAAAGVALLAFSVRAQGASATALDDTGALNRLSAILTADLAQAQDRTTRDVNGVRLPAFSGDATATPLLRLVRAGWSNPDQAPRADLQKVEYRLAGDGLERVAYPALDGAAPLPPALLLDRVRTVQLRFRYRGAWSDTWQGNPRAALPQAVELVVVRDDARPYRLLFFVGTGAGRVQESGAGRTNGAGGTNGGASGGGGVPVQMPGGVDAPR
ncbi:type II secretion system minor pseudopilin GspJ [Sphingomonas sp. DT-51]|uniref:type II secretion system minor pseudopilin GspJ n=1 Tax=Sphingomonas sp. DT-51 TaxID=3396165 RepID=UPI003F1BBBFB